MKNKAMHIKRMRRLLNGSVISFDGNPVGELGYKYKNGLPMSTDAVMYVLNHPWRWELTLGLVCKMGDMVRTPLKTVVISQACHVDELREIVEDQFQIMSLEQPTDWAIKAQTWELRALG